LISYKALADGSSIPYELNINFFDALSDRSSDEDLETQIQRFLVSQAVLLALKGVPAIYVHSLLGSRGWLDGPAQTGHNRSINRQKFTLEDLENELLDPSSLRSRVFSAYDCMLKARTGSPAFSPSADQTVLSTGSSVFSLLRQDEARGMVVLCCHNFTGSAQAIDLPAQAPEGNMVDLISSREVDAREGKIYLGPYEVLWLKGNGD
jgi:hypothetical protein